MRRSVAFRIWLSSPEKSNASWVAFAADSVVPTRVPESSMDSERSLGFFLNNIGAEAKVRV